jgi:hypothetical protein
MPFDSIMMNIRENVTALPVSNHIQSMKIIYSVTGWRSDLNHHVCSLLALHSRNFLFGLDFGSSYSNTGKKREIVPAGLPSRGQAYRAPKRDILVPVAVAGTLSSLTLGLPGPRADMIADRVVGHGMEYAASHLPLDATGAVNEQSHGKHTHTKDLQKLQKQYQDFQR